MVLDTQRRRRVARNCRKSLQENGNRFSQADSPLSVTSFPKTTDKGTELDFSIHKRDPFPLKIKYVVSGFAISLRVSYPFSLLVKPVQAAFTVEMEISNPI